MLFLKRAAGADKTQADTAWTDQADPAALLLGTQLSCGQPISGARRRRWSSLAALLEFITDRQESGRLNIVLNDRTVLCVAGQETDASLTADQPVLGRHVGDRGFDIDPLQACTRIIFPQARSSRLCRLHAEIAFHVIVVCDRGGSACRQDEAVILMRHRRSEIAEKAIAATNGSVEGRIKFHRPQRVGKPGSDHASRVDITETSQVGGIIFIPAQFVAAFQRKREPRVSNRSTVNPVVSMLTRSPICAEIIGMGETSNSSAPSNFGA